MQPTRLAVLAGKARPDLRELVESGSLHPRGAKVWEHRPTHRVRGFTRGRALQSVVDTRLGYVGSAPLVGASREGSIG